MTPVAGAFHRTRPACCEKSMPPPPPLWSDTQVAPEAQFKSGESETASNVSSIASVSWLGADRAGVEVVTADHDRRLK
jgi:hypothetical protein